MSAPKVIVFGPTGAVGSSAARTAAKLGAKVVLAMRDTSKTVPDLDSETEKQQGFERVTADLTKPETVKAAITESGAKRAFFYLSWGMQEGMRDTVQALKDGGIELAVFLSSFTIQGALESVDQSQVIPYAHAQVELNLHAIFGQENFFAARPGAFVSNNLRYKAAINAGEVGIFCPDVTNDNIVQEDIGRVCGTVLAKGVPEDGNRTPYLYGSKLITNAESVEIIAKGIGKNVNIKPLTWEEAAAEFDKSGTPAPVRDYMLGQAQKASVAPKDSLHLVGYPVKMEDMYNIEKYSGQRATRLEEWVEKNGHLFAA